MLTHIFQNVGGGLNFFRQIVFTTLQTFSWFHNQELLARKQSSFQFYDDLYYIRRQDPN